jgi:predicted kinase
MKKLFILRGLPGSGKSTLANFLVGDKDYCHKEADMYFIDRKGDYKFNSSQIKDAHTWCQEEINFLMKNCHEVIVVSNTFTQEWEMQPYIDMAKEFEYTVHSLIVENRHDGKNSHNVPVETINRMKERFETKL